MTEEDKSQEEKIRESAKRRVSSEQLDQMLALSQPRRWVIIISVLILLICLIVWAFFGRIPTEVDGKGVVLGSKGVYSILAKTGGTINHIYVENGQTISEGKAIASIYNPQLRSLLSEIEKNQFKIKSLEAEVEILKKSYETRTSLYEQGLMAKALLEDLKTKVIEKEINLEEAKASLANLYGDLEKASSSTKEEFLAKEAELRASKTSVNLSDLENELTTIKAPSEGVVLELLVKVGDVVEVKDPIVWMEYPHKENEKLFFCYVPIQYGNKIKPGMRVQIDPSTVNVQEYGSIVGKVKEVSPFAISESELNNILRNKQLVKYLTEDIPAVTQIIVEANTDESTPSGFAWTSGKGPPFNIPTGTVCIIKVIVEEEPPISYLIPLWKLKKL